MATTNQQLSMGGTREIPRSFFPSALLFPAIASHWQNPTERESKGLVDASCEGQLPGGQGVMEKGRHYVWRNK